MKYLCSFAIEMFNVVSMNLDIILSQLDKVCFFSFIYFSTFSLLILDVFFEVFSILIMGAATSVTVLGVVLLKGLRSRRVKRREPHVN